MADLDRAVAFVTERGDEVERARLRYALTGEPPARDIVDALLAGQRPDGGWAPFWAPDYSSLDATCFRLAQAEQLGLTAAERAIACSLRFLLDRQRTDGGWEEESSVGALAPPWAAPGDLTARLYLTANCGFWLTIMARPCAEVARAASLLETRLEDDGRLPTFLHAHWLAGGLWYRLGLTAPAERVFARLAARLDEDFPTSNLGWLVTTLRAAGVPAEHSLIGKAASLLAGRQEGDGRWPSEDGPGRDVHATLEALRALRLRDGPQ